MLTQMPTPNVVTFEIEIFGNAINRLGEYY